ncbi:2OG-Fe(II)oxygenase [Colletotrichum tamarilloi]|uniref:2OG-Fe(II)oxygenase n=1 Tax=Colletotrichum tamarilloi TaxID=1209934 RepID=A0ABQ9QVS9_9PEZI|nr:2OG-Fe(II)oxygenase [Colletotrichum tamarilloi]KAK1486755.1 2OG-Fe(II)oxygenase [Colletotrichum tamarilloi]
MGVVNLASDPGTTLLRFASGNGPVTRRILRTPLRDALPTEIPVIDISLAFSPELKDRKTVAQQIRNAATTSGFFYLINHGIASSVTDSAHTACLEYFRQDEETKMRSWVGKSRYFNGYKPPGSQRINKSESVDVRESFSWTYDPRHDPDVVDVNAIPAEARKLLRIEDFHWDGTANQPDFKEAIILYWQSCLKLARVLVRSFALSLDLPEDHFDAKFAYPDAALALNYYPPLSSSATVDSDFNKTVSIGSHTDFQLFTILWQDSVGGLQVLNRQGQWIRAAPIPGTFVVNIADYLQRITNDLYVSTVHRAQNLSGEERISMPFFFGFGLHESCGVVDTCVKEGEKPKYEEIGCEAWVQRRARAMHQVDSDDENDCAHTLLYVFVFVLQPQALSDAASQNFISNNPITTNGQPVDGLSRWLEDFSRSVIPIMCHSHNDYWRPYPLYSALAAGCTGVEADIWLSDDGSELLVGHDRHELSSKKTLRSMYLDPLMKILDTMNPPEQWSNFSRTDRPQGAFRSQPNITIVLLLDVKSDP